MIACLTLAYHAGYLILDTYDVGLGKQMFLYAPLCTIVQAILEVVNWTYRNHSSWKTVSDIHNTSTEKAR